MPKMWLVYTTSDIVQLFLTAKHWQLFLMMAIPLVTFKFFGSGFSALQLGFMLILFVGVVVGWLYSIGITANEKLDPDLAKDTRLFKAALALPLVYIAVVFVVVVMPLSQGVANAEPISWLVPLHFASLAGAFYGFWFVAKQFITLRKGRRVSYIEYALTVLGFWFGIIGVWFLQPKINELLGDS